MPALGNSLASNHREGVNPVGKLGTISNDKSFPMLLPLGIKFPTIEPIGASSEITSGAVELNSMLSPFSEGVENSTNRHSKAVAAFAEKAVINFFAQKIKEDYVIFYGKRLFSNHKKNT